MKQELLKELIAARLISHAAHVNSRCYSDHLLFQKVYEDIDSLIDPLAELISRDGKDVVLWPAEDSASSDVLEALHCACSVAKKAILKEADIITQNHLLGVAEKLRVLENLVERNVRDK